MNNELTVTSTKLLTDLIEDAGNWGGVPLLDGNVRTNTALRGNVTDLKKKGYIHTQLDEGNVWVIFTEKAVEFAAEHGYEGYISNLREEEN